MGEQELNCHLPPHFIIMVIQITDDETGELTDKIILEPEELKIVRQLVGL